MKKILFTAVLFALGTGFATAQDIRHDRKPPMHRKHHGKMAMQHLNLSEEQKKQFRSANEDFRKKMQELQKNDNITVKEWKAKKAELARQHKETMQNLLTKEQKDRIKKQREERMAMAKVDARARQEKMKIRLGLTDQQTEQLNRNRQDLQKKLKAIHENDKLNMEEKKEQSRKLMKENKEKMKSLLTEDQIQKMKEGKGRKPGERSRR